MTPDDCRDIISALDRKIEDATSALAAAKQAAIDIPALEADLARLGAARKALAAPQSPDGRKRIGAAQRGRKRKEQAPEPVTPPVPTCSECHRPGRVPAPCAADGCDAVIHAGDCWRTHYARWHGEKAS